MTDRNEVPLKERLEARRNKMGQSLKERPLNELREQEAIRISSEPVVQNNNGAEPYVNDIVKQNMKLGAILWERPFRLKMLAACLHGNWYDQTNGAIKPEYFDTQEERDFIRFLDRYYNKYNRVPGMEEIAAEFVEYDTQHKDGLMGDLVCDVADILETKSDEFDYVREKALEFARIQAFGIVLAQSIDLRDQGRLDDILPLVEQASNIGAYKSAEWRSPSAVDDYDFTRLKWIIDGVLKQGKVNLFYGESESGKTWLLLDGVKHAILGKDWLGRVCRRVFVIWIDEENREDEMMERLYGLRMTMTDEERKEFDANFLFRTLGKDCADRFNLNDATAVRRLIKEIQKHTDRPVLVVFDSMGAVSYTDDKVISNNEMAIKIMNLLADITIQTEAAIAAIHHPTKEKSNMFGGVFMTNLVDLNIEISRVNKLPDGTEIAEDRHMLKLCSKKDRKKSFGSGGLYVEFLTDGHDELWRTLNPRFELLADAINSQTKSLMLLLRDKVRNDAGAWLRQNPKWPLGMSKNGMSGEHKKLKETNPALPFGRDALWKAVDELVKCGMYEWSSDNTRNANRVLEQGELYQEYADDLMDVGDFTVLH